MILSENEKIKIDLHGYTVQEARVILDKTFEYITKDIKCIVIVHGYKLGETLLKYVRKEYKNSKIKKIEITQNPGITLYFLQN